MNKNSSYLPMFFKGNNLEIAHAISNNQTEIHSIKIKEGNQLEKDVILDLKENTNGFTFYDKRDNIYFENIHNLQKPCIINGMRFSKDNYEECNLKIDNKKAIEVDFVIITLNEDNNIVIRLIEFKNGCNFDTKKSKGEVQCLEATKKVCEKSNFVVKPPVIVCYDAKKLEDIFLKTSMGSVEIMLFEDMVKEMGCYDMNSRHRIDVKKRERAQHYEELYIKNIEHILHLYNSSKVDF